MMKLDQLKKHPKCYYYTDNGVLLCGDCLEILPELEPVDLVLTDPPYGLNYNNGDLAHKRESVFGGDKNKEIARPICNDGETEAKVLFESFLTIVKNKLLKGGACCCCCCCGGGPKPLFAEWTLLMDKIIGFKMAVVWDKGGLGMGLHYRRNYEFILIAQNGQPAHRWNGGNKTPNVWRINKIIPSSKEHPTAKPIWLMSKAILIHSNENDLVLDPFLGQAPTAIACERLNRRWIGIEISEEYCEIGKKRIERELQQKRLHGF